MKLFELIFFKFRNAVFSRNNFSWVNFSFSLIILLFTSFTLSAQEQSKLEIPEYTGRVVDFAGVLSEPEKSKIVQKLDYLERTGQINFAVLIVESTGEDSIFDFSFRVAEDWALGEKGKDNGLLLTIAVKDKKLRMEVGYGLEGVLPDAIVKRITADILIPNIKNKRYAKGIIESIDFISNHLEIEKLEMKIDEKESLHPTTDWRKYAIGLGTPFVLSFLFCFISVIFFQRLYPFFFIVVASAIIGKQITHTTINFLLQILFAFMGYVCFYLLLRVRFFGDSETDWNYSFWDGGSGGSGDTGSGISGGGGSFGGGGASDSWGGGDSGDSGGGDGGGD
jgi:uncharacterized protein